MPNLKIAVRHRHAMFLVGYAFMFYACTMPGQAQSLPSIKRAPKVGSKAEPLNLQIRNVADAAIVRWPNGHIAANGSPVLWGFEPGILLTGMNAAWGITNNKVYLDYIQQSVDQFIGTDGSIRTYDAQAYALNNILLGRQLLTLYRVTHLEKYKLAADLLHQQILHQPRTKSGGFWHAKATPNLLLLDDEFMFAPFLAEYAVTFHQPNDLNTIAAQFELLADHAFDKNTGLLYHGWDESHERPWVNKTTGTSQTLWSRGIGWYLMALVDTLPYYPLNDPHRAALLAILQRTSSALVRAQDPASGLWYQVVDQPNLSGNYFESSSIFMFVYALEKGVRLGYLTASYQPNINHAWASISERFVQLTPAGPISITGTVTHVSLGAAPENDGTYNYYLHAPVVSDDPKGVGAFLLAASEMDLYEKNKGPLQVK